MQGPALGQYGEEALNKAAEQSCPESLKMQGGRIFREKK